MHLRATVQWWAQAGVVNTGFPHSLPKISPIRDKAPLQMLYDERSMGPHAQV